MNILSKYQYLRLVTSYFCVYSITLSHYQSYNLLTASPPLFDLTISLICARFQEDFEPRENVKFFERHKIF